MIRSSHENSNRKEKKRKEKKRSQFSIMVKSLCQICGSLSRQVRCQGAPLRGGTTLHPTWAIIRLNTLLCKVCLFVFLVLQPIVVVFSQSGSGL
jgi:hypothetical protein